MISLCLALSWARAVTTAPPGKGRGAGRPPGAGRAKSEEWRARDADGKLGPRLPARRAGLDAAAPGARGRWVSHAGGSVTPVAPWRGG